MSDQFQQKYPDGRVNFLPCWGLLHVFKISSPFKNLDEALEHEISRVLQLLILKYTNRPIYITYEIQLQTNTDAHT